MVLFYDDNPRGVVIQAEGRRDVKVRLHDARTVFTMYFYIRGLLYRTEFISGVGRYPPTESFAESLKITNLVPQWRYEAPRPTNTSAFGYP